MAPITRQTLLEEACAIASEHGIAALTIRGLATRCGVSVGTVYRHFVNKSELSVAAIESFFRYQLFGDFCNPEGPLNFVEFFRHMATRVPTVIDEFRTHWLKGIEALPADELDASLVREEQMFAHIRHGLAYAFSLDPDIRTDALPPDVTPDAIAGLVLSAVRNAAKGDDSTEALLFCLEKALY